MGVKLTSLWLGVRRNVRDACELVLIPGLAAILPWPLCFRAFRWLSRFEGLYRERWQASLDAARRHGACADEGLWARHARLVAIIDHADLYLMMTRRRSWFRRHVRRAGDWPEPDGAFVGYTFHWAAGFWALHDLAEHGLRAHPLVAAADKGPAGREPLVCRWYYALRNRWIARVLGAETIDVGRDLRKVLAALRRGAGVIAAVDVPPLGGAAYRLPFRRGSIEVPRAMFRLATERGLPAVVFLCDLDLRTGERFVEVVRLTECDDPERLAAEAFSHLSRRVIEQPECWHFWGSYDYFEPRPARAAPAGGGLPVDVIVPVYADLDSTRRCIDSLLAAAGCVPFELIIVADAPPEPELMAYCEELSERPGVHLLSNAENLGFVASVNRGMRLHPERDVVLLNSDVEVPPGWLERLVSSAEAHPEAATLTPFSNDATICSYPWAGWDGGLPGGLGLAGLDAIFARVNAGQAAEIPVGVGCCLFIRRSCLEQVGLFDEVAFGRGYGEECDFCLRASAAGWRHLLCADVFVFHAGGVSFGGEKAVLVEQAQKVLEERWPGYAFEVARFVEEDSLELLRVAVDDARAASGLDEALCVIAERRQERASLKACMKFYSKKEAG